MASKWTKVKPRLVPIKQYDGIGTTGHDIVVGQSLHMYCFAGHLVGSINTSNVREVKERTLYSGAVVREVVTLNSTYMLI